MLREKTLYRSLKHRSCRFALARFGWISPTRDPQVVYHNFVADKCNSNVRSRRGPGNAHFSSIRQVSLDSDFPYFATYRLIGTSLDQNSDAVRLWRIFSPICSQSLVTIGCEMKTF